MTSPQETQRQTTSVGELLLAFSALTSTGLSQNPEHGLRACYIAMRLADRLDLNAEARVDLYYAALAKDAGCACGASQMAHFLGADEREALASAVHLDPTNEMQMLLWLFRQAGRGSGPTTRARLLLNALIHGRRFERDAALEECEVAGRIATRLGLSPATAGALTACTERWDGRGAPLGLAGDAIPLAARIINLTSYVEITHRLSGRQPAIDLVRQRAGSAFDPALCEHLLALDSDEAFWEPLETEPSIRGRVLKLEPRDHGLLAGPPAIDRFAEVVSDLVDLKHPAAAGHGRRVAELAGRAALRLAIGGADLVVLRRAALIHDAGLLELSAHALRAGINGHDPVYRAHPVAPLRLLTGVPELQAACHLASLHHERLDGTGYPTGRRDLAPLAARLLAAACAVDEVGGNLDALPATAFDRDVLEAIAAELGTPPPASAPRPAGLTHREVEVLRLAATGLSVRAIADRLVISPHTARHHLESIYAKTGVRTRAAATLFAAEHGLLD